MVTVVLVGTVVVVVLAVMTMDIEGLLQGVHHHLIEVVVVTILQGDHLMVGGQEGIALGPILLTVKRVLKGAMPVVLDETWWKETAENYFQECFG